MDFTHIPSEILENPHFNKEDSERNKELDDMFSTIKKMDGSVTNLKEYRTLIDEINGRIYAEYRKKQSIKNYEMKMKELEAAKAELASYHFNSNS